MKLYLNTIRMQILLMVRKKEFQFVYLINMGYILLTYIYYAMKYVGREISTIPEPHAVFALQDSSIFFDVYINILPFLVVFPFAMSFINDKKNLLLPILQVRSGVKRYYVSKGIACFIGGFCAFFIPLMINICLNNITFPNSRRTFLGDLFDVNYDAGITGQNIIIPTRWAGLWFPEVFLESPEIYNILYAFLFSIAMGIFGVFVYSISFWIKKNKMILLLPLYLIVATLNIIDMFMQNMQPYVCYKIFQYLTINIKYGKNPIYIYIVLLSMVLISMILIQRQINRDQIE